MFRSKLENLPDEILIEICNYLNSIDVINALGQLNSRLERTTRQFQNDINLQYATLSQFQRFCSQLVPCYANRIVKFTLNTWYAPGAMQLFIDRISLYPSLHDLLPALRQLWLINFSNFDVNILPKILTINKVMIDVDSQIPLLHSTKVLLDQYLFCTPNKIKDLRLYGADDGFCLQHNVEVRICENLEKLTTSVATLDDLLLILRRAPCLTKLHVEVNRLSSEPPKQYASMDMMPKRMKDFHLWIKDQQLLPFDDLYVLLQSMPTIERLSLEIETNDIQYSEGYRWKDIFSNLPNLSRLDLGLKIWIGGESTPIDVMPSFETFLNANLKVCCYSDSRVLYIDTIPYEFDSTTGIMTSPFASKAKATDMRLLQKKPRNVNTLCFDGRHELTSARDWLTVIHRFSHIQVLDLVSMNIDQQTVSEQLEKNVHFCLPNLTILRYVRSTKCKVNMPFFMYLANNRAFAPHLHTLTIMYGDLIYLCKHLPEKFCFKHFKELCVYSNAADGNIIQKDILKLIEKFPNLEHFWIHVQSSRTINRCVEIFVECFIRMLPNLVNFRLSCKRGSFRLTTFHNTMDTHLSWIKRLCQFNGQQNVHVIVEKKQIALWK